MPPSPFSPYDRLLRIEVDRAEEEVRQADSLERFAYDVMRGVEPRRPPVAPSIEPPVRRAPGVMIPRLSGPLNALVARGVAREAEDHVIELFLEPDEIRDGGMITVSMRVPVRCEACATGSTATCTQCQGTGSVEDVYAAWLAVRPDATDGTILTPSANLPDMLHPVTFRVRLTQPA